LPTEKKIASKTSINKNIILFKIPKHKNPKKEFHIKSHKNKLENLDIFMLHFGKGKKIFISFLLHLKHKYFIVLFISKQNERVLFIEP
jgi:hypothetical protein